MNHNRTPVFSALLEHAAKKPTQFHIPGHSCGNGMLPEFREALGETALSMDLISIAPLDDPHRAQGIIKEAQALAADAFGAHHTFFCVEGTSGAIRAMVAGVCNPGDEILVPRNIHKSVLSGIILTGAIARFMMPDHDDEFGIAHGVSLDTVRLGLDLYPNVKGVLIINPTYYGVCADLKEIVKLAHSRKVPVLVDEAHGAHLRFNEKLPFCAMDCGADVAATSVHKLGGSLTQSSLLNVREGLVNPKRIFSLLSLMMTTSPSYLLMSSLDCARKNLALNGKTMLEGAIDLANRTRNEINTISGVYCFGTEILGSSSRFAIDPCKLCINVRDVGVTGIEVERLFRERYGIEVELSSLYNILCIVSIGTTEEATDKLVMALRELSNERFVSSKTKRSSTKMLLPSPPQTKMSMRDAFFAETTVMSLKEAVGRISADTICVYPPGIPVLLPGEVISQESTDFLFECDKAGLPVHGLQDSVKHTVRVIKSDPINDIISLPCDALGEA
jgi:arginine decarboxylase